MSERPGEFGKPELVMPDSDYRRERAALLRSKAQKYLKRAKTTPDPQERKKFFDYAALYAQMSARSASGDDPTAPDDRDDGADNLPKLGR